MNQVDSRETYTFGTKKDLVSKREWFKCKDITKRCSLHAKHP